jgi:signal transduction histidine kinase
VTDHRGATDQAGLAQARRRTLRFIVRLRALGDAGRVRQILRNLMGNALRYGAPPRVVRAAPASVATVEIAVADSGEEIPVGVRDRVFDTFVSLPVEGGKPGSIGLGLSVSRHLARIMGGDLVHRRLNGETQFVLTLPGAPGG